MKARQKLQQIADEVDGELRVSYSGCGMYGKTCLGIVCEDPDTVKKMANEEKITGACQDSMGLDYIVYWPKIKE